MIQIGNKKFELMEDYRDAWDQEAFIARYSEVLDRYDVIVGDWGYNQLRLKGFFKEKHGKTSKDSLVQTIEDYIIEHCNFGCKYFILERVRNPQPAPQKTKEPATSN